MQNKLSSSSPAFANEMLAEVPRGFLMDYRKVFHLAEKKGYYFIKEVNGDYLPDSYFRVAVTTEQKVLLQLNLIQEWLRDKHKIIVIALPTSCLVGDWLYNYKVISGQDVNKFLSKYDTHYTKYEYALLEGVKEGLNLLP